ncbi:MAG: proline iminopeptidase-family hydrolase [Dehalococcoidia bacterium]
MAIQPQEGYIEVPGGKVWYEVVGSGAGLPLITLHGGPGSTHFGLEPLKALSSERPVIFYDQLGCGNSDRPDDLTLWRVERFVEELCVLKNSLRLDKFHLLGHSWGTMLGIDYYLAHPEGIVSLVLSSPCISIPRWLADCNRYRKQLPLEVQAVMDRHEAAGTTDSEEYQAAEEEFNKRHVRRMDPLPAAVVEARQQRGAVVYATMWGPNEFFMDGNLRDYDRSGDLHRIAVPSLYSCGRVDEAAPDTVQGYADLTPNAEFTVFEHSAHMPYWEETDRYLSVVRDFLRRVEERA